jgi:hypothetical protein
LFEIQGAVMKILILAILVLFLGNTLVQAGDISAPIADTTKIASCKMDEGGLSSISIYAHNSVKSEWFIQIKGDEDRIYRLQDATDVGQKVFTIRAELEAFMDGNVLVYKPSNKKFSLVMGKDNASFPAKYFDVQLNYDSSEVVYLACHGVK